MGGSVDLVAEAGHRTSQPRHLSVRSRTQGRRRESIGWTDGDSHGSAAIPIADFKRYVLRDAIQFVGGKAPVPLSARESRADPR
jgi:hypothetical protein